MLSCGLCKEADDYRFHMRVICHLPLILFKLPLESVNIVF